MVFSAPETYTFTFLTTPRKMDPSLLHFSTTGSMTQTWDQAPFVWECQWVEYIWYLRKMAKLVLWSFSSASISKVIYHNGPRNKVSETKDGLSRSLGISMKVGKSLHMAKSTKNMDKEFYVSNQIYEIEKILKCFPMKKKNINIKYNMILKNFE